MEYGETNGPDGRLEWMFDQQESDQGMILCHPHPLYGGSMLDGVLDIASNVAKQLGISVVRFNFRSVGASEGAHDHGTGEVDDLKTIVAEFKPQFEHMILGGYSFGANVALNYVERHCDDSKLIVFAPPTANLSADIDNEIHVLVGDADTISSADAIRLWAGSNSKRTIHEIEDADHFLAGYPYDLKEILQRVLAS